MSVESKDVNDTIWTPEQEQLIRMWAEKAQGRSWLHNKSQKYFSSLSNKFIIPATICGTIATTFQFSLLNDDTAGFYSKIIPAVLTFAGTVLGGLQKSFNFQGKEEQHRKSFNEFSSYFRDISAELSLPASERKDSKKYVSKCRLDFDRLIKTSPLIPEHIIELFNQTFADVKIYKPDVVCGLTNIEIFDRTNRLQDVIDQKVEKKLLQQKVFLNWKYNNLQHSNNLVSKNPTHTIVDIPVGVDDGTTNIDNCSTIAINENSYGTKSNEINIIVDSTNNFSNT